jgi:arginyl-tRNA synthetase
VTPSQLTDTVLRAVRRAVEDGELAAAAAESVASGRARVVVERPRPGGQGDWATNVALQLAGPAARPPRQVAETLRDYLDGSDGVADVVVTGPGFLNFSLGASATAELVARVLREGPLYGHATAAPPAHLHAPYEVRAVVVMDAVARVLRSQGAVVRTSCAAPVRPEWVDVLGVRDAEYGDVRGGCDIRPVPADGDPVPLGRDAGRWALLHPAGHDRARLDADAGHLAQREANPLFRVRYAHARTAALGRNAAALGFAAEPGDVPGQGALTGLLADHPRVLAAAARHRAPDRLARHLVEVADTFLADLHPGVLPVGGEKPSAAHRARLALAEATGTVLAGGLTLLGIDAPAHL